MSVEIKLKSKKGKKEADIEMDIASEECDLSEINNIYSKKCGNNNKEQLKIESENRIELLKNPPLIPLWYNGDFQIIYGNVKNFQFNAMRFFSFKEVYIGD